MNRFILLFLAVMLPVFATVLWLFGGPSWLECIRGLVTDWRRAWGES